MNPDGCRARSEVLVVGEALIDIVGNDDEGEMRVPGGSPANVAVGLGRLDVPTTLLTCIASDDDGQRILDHLAGNGVRVHPHSFGADRTPTARAAIGVDGQPRYTFDVLWRVQEAAGIDLPDVVHIGSYSAFTQPGGSEVRLIAARARDEGRLVTFDPNVRAALMPGVTESRAAFEHLASLAAVVKLSDEDASWLYPGATPDDVLRRLSALGVRVAAMTSGSHGSVIASGPHRVEVPAQRTQVIDTIGAGDSYMSALIQGVMQVGSEPVDGHILRRIAHRSTVAAALTVSRRGAEPPRWAELAHL